MHNKHYGQNEPDFFIKFVKVVMCKTVSVRGDHIKYRLPKKDQSDGCGSFST
jgi:hypothetical protein